MTQVRVQCQVHANDGNKILGFINGGQCLDQLSDCKLLGLLVQVRSFLFCSIII